MSGKTWDIVAENDKGKLNKFVVLSEPNEVAALVSFQRDQPDWAMVRIVRMN